MKHSGKSWWLVGLVALVAIPAIVGAQTQKLPISVWVDLQSTGSYMFWTTESGDRNLSIDAWGKRAQFFGLNVGTTIDGSVTVRRLVDGKAQVTVHALTRNAICWGSQWDGAAYQPAFGYTPRQIKDNGRPASLGDALHKIVFTMASPESPLPPPGELGSEDYPVETWSAVVSCSGLLRAGSGYPDETPGKAHVTQQGLVKRYPGFCPAGDCWPAEVVNFWPTIMR